MSIGELVNNVRRACVHCGEKVEEVYIDEGLLEIDRGVQQLEGYVRMIQSRVEVD